MSDPSQLPHLLDLIDDDSEVVRRSVMEALAVFGPSLREALAGMEDPPDETERRRVLALVDAYGNQPHRDDGSSDPRFEVGQLVCHVRYDYRGVVVDLDTACKADADWYLRNTTQPDRDQPWYHVLVHGSSSVTYAAQTSLTEDPSTEEVVHPFITLFFTELSRGRYIRNDRPWPEDR